MQFDPRKINSDPNAPYARAKVSEKILLPAIAHDSAKPVSKLGSLIPHHKRLREDRLRTEQMKAILVREFGGPGVVELEEVPAPLPAAGLVLLRSHTIRANPYDTYMRSGVYAISRPAIDTRLWAFESGKMFPESPRRTQTEILESETERIANEDQRLDSTYYRWNKRYWPSGTKSD